MTSKDDANGLDWQRYEAEAVDLFILGVLLAAGGVLALCPCVGRAGQATRLRGQGAAGDRQPKANETQN